jgi:putative transposase
MTRTRYKLIKGDQSPYFITGSVVQWLPVFNNPKIAQIILDTLAFLQDNNRLVIYAYVLMENHLHLIASSTDLGRQIASFKSYSARKCIDYFIMHNNQYMLDKFAVHKPSTRQDRRHQFWQEGVHPKQIQGEEMMRQKIEYIHQNPVRRGYIDNPEHWRYSSARNYLGIEGVLEVCIGW